MEIGNVSTSNLEEVAFGQVQDILVNAEGSTRRITKSNFLGVMNDWSTITNKPFDAFDNAYFRTTERSDGADILTLSDNVIAYFGKVDTLQADVIALDAKIDENYQASNQNLSDAMDSVNNSIGSMSSYFSDQLQKIGTDFSNNLNNTNSRVSELESNSHIHDNMDVIDLFTISDNKLLWNGTAVGNDYELPVATASTLGGIKPDGITITVDSDGTIHGASQGLDFDSLSTAMTTGTQSGITVTADTENSRFNFEVTGIPTIAIDGEGYWTVDGERGTNPTKAQGEKGDDGVSPTASVIETETGATITITDGLGTTTVDISNGTDGISPHIDSSTNHWFVGVTDTGVNATAAIDDTSTDGTDVSWSASKINSVIGDINTILASVVGGVE